MTKIELFSLARILECLNMSQRKQLEEIHSNTLNYLTNRQKFFIIYLNYYLTGIKTYNILRKLRWVSPNVTTLILSVVALATQVGA
jgi:hypothetical protein